LKKKKVTIKLILEKLGLFNVLTIGTLLYFFYTIAACQTADRTIKPTVAKVGTVNLYLSEIKALKIPYNNKNDSIDFVEKYIEDWVRSQLFLNKADEFLPNELKEIDQQIADYRKSLLTFNYEQQLLTKNVNNKVSEDEINEYFKTYKNNFKLAESIIKTKYLVVESDIINLDSIKVWIKSNNEIAQEHFEITAISFASSFSLGDEWLSYEAFKDKLPNGMLQKGNLLRKNKFVEYEEEDFIYLSKTIDIAKKGTVAPLEYKKQDIEKIIVNKRKIDYLKRIKDKIYNDAVSKNEFEIYDLEKK